MTELLLHFAISFAAFSYFRRPREAFTASLFAFLPDLDVLIGVHRSWTHSIFLVLAFCGVMLVFIRALRVELLGLGILVTFALFSHLLFDLFTTYTPLLWPLSSRSYHVSLDAGVKVGESVRVYVDLGLFRKLTSFTHFESLDAPVFTSEGFVISAVLVASVFLSRYQKALRKLIGI